MTTIKTGLTPKQEIKLFANLYDIHAKIYNHKLTNGGQYRITFNLSNKPQKEFIEGVLRRYKISFYSNLYRIEIRYKKNVRTVLNLIKSNVYHKKEEVNLVLNNIKKEDKQKQQKNKQDILSYKVRYNFKQPQSL